MVFLARAGLGTGRSGTAARSLDQNAFKPLTITSYMQAIKNKELNDILGPGGGERFYYKDKGAKAATFHELEFLDTIAKFGSAHPNEKPKVITMLSNVFGQQGAVIANMISDPQMVKYLDATIKAMHQPSLTIDAMMDAYNKSNYPQQVARMTHNWHMLEIEMIKNFLPSIASAIGSIGDASFAMQNYLHGHPASFKGIKEWINAVTDSIKRVTTFFDKNPGAVGQMGQLAQVVAVIASIGIAKNLLGVVANLLMIPRIIAAVRGAEAAALVAGPAGVAVELAVIAAAEAYIHRKEIKSRFADDRKREIKMEEDAKRQQLRWIKDHFQRPHFNLGGIDLPSSNVHHASPRKDQKSTGGQPTVHNTTFNINGTVYDKPALVKLLTDLMNHQQKNPLHQQSANPAGTSAFAPPFLSLTAQ